MGQLRDDLRRTTEQYRELNQALVQQQQQITSLQVSSVREILTLANGDVSPVIL